MKCDWRSIHKTVTATAAAVAILSTIGLDACQPFGSGLDTNVPPRKSPTTASPLSPVASLPTDNSNEESSMPTTDMPSPHGLEELVSQAKEDLARWLSVEVEQVQVLEAVSVVWPDAIAGCPQPAMRYKQVPTEGVLIRLEAAGQLYEYHGGGNRGLFRCQQAPK